MVKGVEGHNSLTLGQVIFLAILIVEFNINGNLNGLVFVVSRRTNCQSNSWVIANLSNTFLVVRWQFINGITVDNTSDILWNTFDHHLRFGQTIIGNGKLITLFNFQPFVILVAIRAFRNDIAFFNFIRAILVNGTGPDTLLRFRSQIRIDAFDGVSRIFFTFKDQLLSCLSFCKIVVSQKFVVSILSILPLFVLSVVLSQFAFIFCTRLVVSFFFLVVLSFIFSIGFIRCLFFSLFVIMLSLSLFIGSLVNFVLSQVLVVLGLGGIVSSFFLVILGFRFLIRLISCGFFGYFVIVVSLVSIVFSFFFLVLSQVLVVLCLSGIVGSLFLVVLSLSFLVGLVRCCFFS